MNREQLEHAIRAACDVANETEIWVFGSQSILGQHPEAPEALRFSMELDVDALSDPGLTDAIDFNLGEGSQFHEAHGFYVHGVSIQSAILPVGWKDRTVCVENANTRENRGRCLEAHDLAASKLAANRPKDREFVRTLLKEGLVSAGRLGVLIGTLPMNQNDRERIATWVRGTAAELEA